MRIFLLWLLIALTGPSGLAVEGSYVTLTAGQTNENAGWNGYKSSTLDLSADQAAEIVGLNEAQNAPPWISLERNGNVILRAVRPVMRQIFTGPARLVVTALDGSRGATVPRGFITFRIISKTVPPDKTILLSEGTTNRVALESSTNLVHWTETQPGLFLNTNSPSHLFFRLRADKLAAP